VAESRQDPSKPDRRNDYPPSSETCRHARSGRLKPVDFPFKAKNAHLSALRFFLRLLRELLGPWQVIGVLPQTSMQCA
jgi:hypothetical protein